MNRHLSVVIKLAFGVIALSACWAAPSPRQTLLLQAVGDMNLDGKEDRVELTTSQYASAHANEPECRRPMLHIYLSEDRGGLKEHLKTSAPFIEDCVFSPSSYELNIRRGVLVLSIFQETSDLRLDAKFRFDKSRKAFQLIGLDRSVTYPNGVGQTHRVSINYLTRSVVIDDLSGKTLVRKKIDSQVWDMCCFDASTVYFRESLSTPNR